MLQVIVSQQERKNRYFLLSRSLKKIGKYISRGNWRSIASAVIQNPSLKKEIVSSVCKEIQRVGKGVCSDAHDSILRMTLKPAIENFMWERIWQELELNPAEQLPI